MKPPQLKLTHVLGIDVSKATFHVALAALSDPENYLQHTFANTPAGFRALMSWLAKHCPKARLHVCMEATGPYSLELALFLDGKVSRLSVENPRRIKAYASCRLRRCKSDPADARLIALYALTQKPRAWQRPSQARLQVRALARHLDFLQVQLNAQRNRLATAREAFLKKELRALIAFLENHIAVTEKELLAVVKADETLAHQYQLLIGIRSIGAPTATRLLAELPNLEALDDARQLASFAGVTPRHRQSGTSGSNFTPLSKTGSARLRKILYWPAVNALRYNPACKAFAARLAAKGKKKMSIIGAVMAKLLRMVFGVLKHERPFEADFHLHRKIPQPTP